MVLERWGQGGENTTKERATFPEGRDEGRTLSLAGMFSGLPLLIIFKKKCCVPGETLYMIRQSEALPVIGIASFVPESPQRALYNLRNRRQVLTPYGMRTIHTYIAPPTSQMKAECGGRWSPAARQRSSAVWVRKSGHPILEELLGESRRKL